MRFPTSEVEAALHQRVLASEPTVPTDVFGSFMEPLCTTVRHDLRCSDDVIQDSVIDALFEYLQSPTTYDPSRGRLGTYLTQIAKNRAVDRLRSRSAEAQREKEFGALVELRSSAPNEEMERAIEAEELWKNIEQQVPDPRDRATLALILQGERTTLVLAKALEIDALPELQRRREVKRHRDRLMKILERLGASLRGDQGT